VGVEGANYDSGDDASHTRYPCKLDNDSPTIGNILCVNSASDSGHVCAATDSGQASNYGAIVDMSVNTQDGTTTDFVNDDLFTDHALFRATGCYVSEAVPAAAGVAAQLFGLFPQATGAQVKQAILAGGIAAAGLAGKTASGKALDAEDAVDGFE